MIATNTFRKGVKILYDDKPYVIVDFQHVSPGKGAAFCKTKLKNLETKQVLEINFKSGDMVNVPEIELRDMQYLYSDGSSYTFMDGTTFDQVTLSADEIGDFKYFIIENSMAKVTFYKGKALDIEVDNFVVLEVTETQPNIKGDTSSGGGKPATLSTGLVVNVPFHISRGDFLKIDTRTSKYVEKVK